MLKIFNDRDDIETKLDKIYDFISGNLLKRLGSLKEVFEKVKVEDNPVIKMLEDLYYEITYSYSNARRIISNLENTSDTDNLNNEIREIMFNIRMLDKYITRYENSQFYKSNKGRDK